MILPNDSTGAILVSPIDRDMHVVILRVIVRTPNRLALLHAEFFEHDIERTLVLPTRRDFVRIPRQYVMRNRHSTAHRLTRKRDHFFLLNTEIIR